MKKNKNCCFCIPSSQENLVFTAHLFDAYRNKQHTAAERLSASLSKQEILKREPPARIRETRRWSDLLLSTTRHCSLLTQTDFSRIKSSKRSSKSLHLECSTKLMTSAGVFSCRPPFVYSSLLPSSCTNFPPIVCSSCALLMQRCTCIGWNETYLAVLNNFNKSIKKLMDEKRWKD